MAANSHTGYSDTVHNRNPSSSLANNLGSSIQPIGFPIYNLTLPFSSSSSLPQQQQQQQSVSYSIQIPDQQHQYRQPAGFSQNTATTAGDRQALSPSQLVDELRDHKYYKATVQGINSNPCTKVAFFKRPWFIALIVFMVLGLFITAAVIAVVSSSSHDSASSSSHSTDVDLHYQQQLKRSDELYYASKNGTTSSTSTSSSSLSISKIHPVLKITPLRARECGYGTKKQQQGIACEPDYALMLDPGALEAKRRGTCSPPLSITKWVCSEYTNDKRNDGHKIVDDYLVSRADQWLATAFDSSSRIKGSFLQRASTLCTEEEDIAKKDTPPVMIEKLRREILSADNWNMLSRSLGVAAAFGHPLFLCFREDGVLGNCSMGKEKQQQQQDNNTRPLSTLSKNGSFDAGYFVTGLKDGWKRSLGGFDPQREPHNLAVDADFVSRVKDFGTTAIDLSLWKQFFADRLKQSSSSLFGSYSLKQEASLILQALVTREMALRDGPLDPDGAPVRYLYRAFDQLRESYIEALASKHRDTQRFESMKLFVPPFQALDFLSSWIDTAIGYSNPESCSDLLLIIKSIRAARSASGKFSIEEIALSDIHLLRPLDTPASVPIAMYVEKYNSFIIAPMALTAFLYRPPSDASDPYAMVDAYGRIGWRLSREMAKAIPAETQVLDRLALCAAYRVLCKHGASKCASIEMDDIDWMKRFLWDVAVTSCGDEKRSKAIDDTANSYPLYRIAFSCNGIFVYTNSSAAALDCWQSDN